MYNDLEHNNEMEEISDDLEEISDDLGEIMECQQRAKRAYDTACDNETAASSDYYDTPCPRTLKVWKAAKRTLTERYEACEELALDFASAWESHHGYGEN